MSALVPAPAEYVARSCSACGSLAEPEQLYEKWGYAILRCPDCGLGSTCAGDFDPARIYSRDYFSGGRSDGYADYVGSEAVLRKESRRVLRALADAGCSSAHFWKLAVHMVSSWPKRARHLRWKESNSVRMPPLFAVHVDLTSLAGLRMRKRWAPGSQLTQWSCWM